MFSARLKSLNDTLVQVIPPETKGFNLSLVPDSVNPQVSISTEVDSPFKVEIAALGEGRAALRVTSSNEFYGAQLDFPDIQTFVRRAFPDQQVIVAASPVISIKNPVYLRRYSIPGNLYEEQKDPDFIREREAARVQSTERFLDGLLPRIEVDIQELTEAEIGRLTSPVEGAKVDVTFYRKYDRNPKARRISRRESMLAATARFLYHDFELKFPGSSLPILRLEVENPYSPQCYISELHFAGTSAEVERVMEEFNELMKLTHNYK